MAATTVGNFDMGLDDFQRISSLYATPHARCDVLYLVRMLIGC